MIDIDSARSEAQKNLQKLSRLLSPRLQEREDQLPLVFSIHKGNVLNKLHDLYLFMDELRLYIDQVTPCRKGCSYCCHIPVSVSPLEVEYLKSRMPNLRKKIGLIDPDTSSPCPFLTKGACSIYSARPFFCRYHVALTPTAHWCHPNRCHQDKLPQLILTGVFRAYEQIVFENGGLGEIIDIRKIFVGFK